MTIAPTTPSLPRVEKLPNGAHQFILNDEPFLLLAGELNNSSFSNSAFLHEQTAGLKASNLNTVLGAVSWEQIEPVEGQFDFDEFDECVRWAREAGLRVVLLWFGAYKNGASSYVPHWVKRDIKRFPRSRISSGPSSATTAASSQKTKVCDVVSLFGDNLAASDARAFGALLEHLRVTDGAHQTVIMLQVENEPGQLGDSRDRSAAADRAFASPPPSDLVTFLHEHASTFPLDTLTKDLTIPSAAGTSWEATFGASKRTDELFMAYHYATYHNTVAAAGKAAYPLPLYANVWIAQDEPLEVTLSAIGGLEQGEGASAQHDQPAKDDVVQADGGGVPGSYPSGGGVQHMVPIWQKFAPHLSFIAPDIYVDEHSAICEHYGPLSKQALFIPEQRRNEQGALWSWDAIGTHGAIGVSPFAIDSIPASDINHWTAHYALLSKVAPVLLEARQAGRKIYGFHFDRYEKGQPDPSPVKEVVFGQWRLSIARAFVFGHPSPGYGLIIELEGDGDRFMLIGEGYQVGFKSTRPEAEFTSLLAFDEIDLVRDGKSGHTRQVRGRMLNGDETCSLDGVVARMPYSEPDYGGFHICITIPARTKIAIAQPFCIDASE